MSSKRKQLTLSAVILIACFIAVGFFWHSSFLIFAFTMFLCTFFGVLAFRLIKDPLIIGACLGALVLPVFIVAAEYLSHPLGNPLLLSSLFFVVIGAGLSLIIAVAFFLLLAAFPTRYRIRFFKLSAICFGSLFILGGSVFLGHLVRNAVLDEFADRTAPLIQAIDRFSKEQGRAPRVLNDLVPKYIASIPETGLAFRRSYKYTTDGTEWSLSISWEHGPGDWDAFVYKPSHDYSDQVGAKGDLKQIGDWGLILEDDF